MSTTIPARKFDAMSLIEWSQKSPVAVRVFDASGVYVVADIRAIDGIRSQLWRLRDAKVTSVTGGSIWLLGPAYSGTGQYLL